MASIAAEKPEMQLKCVLAKAASPGEKVLVATAATVYVNSASTSSIKLSETNGSSCM